MVLSIAPSPVPPSAADAVEAPVSLEAVGALLRGLNREQRRAVTHGEGPQLVIAGPGTGKTEVVTRRVAWLIATKRARPREVLALTFTDAAAEEMQSRVDQLVPYGQADASIHTFHALGDRLLREHAFELGLPGDVRLVNRAEAIVVLRENLFELGLERYLPLGDPTRFLAALVELFQRAKDEAVTPEAFAAHAQALLARASGAAEDAAMLADLGVARAELAAAYGAYQRLLASHGLIDHGDQVTLALQLLRDRPAIRQAVVSRYQYLLVDEFQDTNSAQIELVLALTGEGANLTVVGDPDQAIYTFRGAAVGNLERLRSAHPNLSCTVLRRNYRSRAPILEASGRLIANNYPGGLALRTAGPSQLVAHRRSRAPAPVRRLVAGSPAEEVDAVAAHIHSRIAGGERPADFAVLVRTNGEAESFMRSLAARGVAARMAAPAKLTAQPAVRSLLAYLRVMANPDDSVELYLLAAGEPYALEGPDLARLLQQARRRHRSLWQVLREVGDARSDLLADGPRRAAARLVADVEHGLSRAPIRTSGEVLYDYLKRSGRLAQLAAADRVGRDPIVLRSIARLFDVVRSRARLLAEDRVSFLVAHLAALEESGADERDAGPLGENAVSVLTVHRAKGLEFRYVYACGLVDGRFPSHGRPPLLSLPAELLSRPVAAPDEEPLAEERRLAYVAMTRARDELWLSHHTAGPDGRGRRRPSPFLAEALDVPADVLSPHDGGALRRLAPAPAAPSPAEVPPLRDTPGAPLMLSYSQLDDYLSCPERYRLRHVVGLPTPTHHALSYGSAMHQAVATFHLRRAKGVAMSEQELIDAFAAAWTGEGFLSREHEEARFAAGSAALRRFREQQLAGDQATVAIERPFSFSVAADVVRGRMDRVDQTPDGAVIVDYKASHVTEQAKADARARDSFQLQIYALAHEAETGRLPHEVQLHFLDSSVIGRATPDPARLAKAHEKIAVAAAGIRERRFAAKPNAVGCSYCPFRDACASSAA